jgi:hypothetical protein
MARQNCDVVELTAAAAKDDTLLGHSRLTSEDSSRGSKN